MGKPRERLFMKFLGKGHRQLNRKDDIILCWYHISTQNHSWTKVLIKTVRSVNPILALILLRFVYFYSPVLTVLHTLASPSDIAPVPIRHPNAHPAKLPSTLPGISWNSKETTLHPNLFPMSSVLCTASGSLPWYPSQVGNVHSLTLREAGKKGPIFL